MDQAERLRDDLGRSMAGAATPLAAANQLCRACVDLLEVDGASISLVHAGTTRGTFGSSNEASRRLDELQFTFGEGPCLDAVRSGAPVVALDLDDPTEHRWPAFTGAALQQGVTKLLALPVAVARAPVGALDLYSSRSGPLPSHTLAGGLLAAELAALPLLDLMSTDVDWAAAAEGEGDGWDQLASLERVEVYQATGMVMAALDVEAAEALVRLRARAYTLGRTASELSWDVVERRLLIDPREWGGGHEHD